jgi:hypothetical protein
MPRVIGTVKETVDGKFYAISKNGNSRELSNGEKVYENENIVEIKIILKIAR